MKFTQIYDHRVTEQLNTKKRKRMLIFCAISAVFVVYCTLFVCLAVVKTISPFLGCVANGLATIAYAWYVVLFVKIPPQHTILLRFLHKVPLGDKARFCCKFVGLGNVTNVDGLLCQQLLFDGMVLFLPTLVNVPFKQDAIYHLVAVGKMLTEYATNEVPYDD